MWTRHRKPARLKLLVFPVVAVAICGYFIQNSTTGKYGLESKSKYSEEIALLRSELAELVEERLRAEHRVALLSEGTLERDMIDEQARRALGLARADEIILLHSTN